MSKFKKIHINQLKGDNPTGEIACDSAVKLLMDNTGEEQELTRKLVNQYYNIYSFRWAGRYLLEEIERIEFIRREKIYQKEYNLSIKLIPFDEDRGKEKEKFRKNLALLFYDLYNGFYDWEKAQDYVEPVEVPTILNIFDNIYNGQDIITEEMVLGVAEDTRWFPTAKKYLNDKYYYAFETELNRKLNIMSYEIKNIVDTTQKGTYPSFINSKRQQALLFREMFNLQKEEEKGDI